MKNHEFKIKIEAQFNMTKAKAFEKLKNWLEHNAHTSSGHGFEFVELSKLGDDE